MVTRKNVFKHVAKKLSSITKASPEQVGKYASRAALNVASGGYALSKAAMALKEGDVRGAAAAGHTAANKIIGKKNIKAASNVVLGKKATQQVSKGVKTLNRADKAFGQYETGDFEGAANTAMGKKMRDKMNAAPDPDSKMSHHIARAKHHSEQAQAVHTALTGKIPAVPIGAGGMRTLKQSPAF